MKAKISIETLHPIHLFAQLALERPSLACCNCQPGNLIGWWLHNNLQSQTLHYRENKGHFCKNLT